MQMLLMLMMQRKWRPVPRMALLRHSTCVAAARISMIRATWLPVLF